MTNKYSDLQCYSPTPWQKNMSSVLLPSSSLYKNPIWILLFFHIIGHIYLYCIVYLLIYSYLNPTAVVNLILNLIQFYVGRYLAVTYTLFFQVQQFSPLGTA